MEKYGKIIAILLTILLVVLAGFTGCFDSLFSTEYHFRAYMFQLNSIFIMLSICLVVTSEFVEKRRKLLFNLSLLIPAIGLTVGAVLYGYANPTPITYNATPGLISSLTFFGSILFGNVLGNTLIVLLAPTILVPYLMFTVMISRFCFVASIISYYGINGLTFCLLQPQMYLELFASALAFISSFKIIAKTTKSITSIHNTGIKHALIEIKNVEIYETKKTIPKILIILIIAATLETFLPMNLLGNYLLRL